MRALRLVVAVLIGLVIANLTVFGWEWAVASAAIGGVDGFDGMDLEDMLRTGGPGVRLAIAAGWIAGTGVGAFTAFALARSDWTGWLVAAWIAVTALGTSLMYPFELWFRSAAVALPFVGAVIAFGFYRRWRAARLHVRAQ